MSRALSSGCFWKPKQPTMVSNFPVSYSTHSSFFIHHFFFFFFFFNQIHSDIPALPPDTPLADLGALAAYDLNKLPDARKSGEDIIREIQQELLTRVGSSESAVVPEQDAQRLMVGVRTCIIIFLIHPFFFFNMCTSYTLF